MVEPATAPPVAEAAPAGTGRRRRRGTPSTTAPTPEDQREVAAQIAARREELAQEAATAAREADPSGERTIAAFGPAAIAQLADALTIRIPRAGPAGSMVGS